MSASVGENNMEIVLKYILAFAIGGIFCVIAQLLIDKTALTPARILVSYVVSGVILGAVGVYQKIVDIGGAGATTPLTGFGYLIAKGTKAAVDSEGIWGAIKGPISSAAVGITGAIVLGLAASLIFRDKRKK